MCGRLNADIFGGRLPADLVISWNNNLKTTAGLTHYKRQILPDPSAPPLCALRPHAKPVCPKALSPQRVPSALFKYFVGRSIRLRLPGHLDWRRDEAVPLLIPS